MCQLRNVLAASVVVILLSVSMASATVVISDTFTLTAERTDHLILTGQTTEVGGVQWLGETSTVGYYYFLTADGKVNRYRDGSNTSQGDRVMAVPYSVNPAGEIVTISADITWGQTTVATQNASGIGFLPNGVVFDATQTFWDETSLGVFIYETGRWKLFIQNLGQALVTLIDTDITTEYAALGSLTTNGARTENVKISYDTENNLCNVWFGAQQLVNNMDLTDKNPGVAPEWAPNISYGSFTLPGRGDTPNNRVDNFLMETNPVPEPLTLSLLLAGGTLFARKRK